MPMSLDLKDKKFMECADAMSGAASNADSEAFQTAVVNFANHIQEQVLQEAQGLVSAADNSILASRGARLLTSEETKYYNSVIDAMRSPAPKSELTNLNIVLPETVIDRVFEDITTNHPLLSYIDFQNTGALIKIITSTMDGVAGWGALCDPISDEVSGAFMQLDLTQKKLSAYIPVCKAMLDLGPVWLDRYVRTILAEALAIALEAGIVDGDGKDAPIGMTRALSGATDGVYPRKTPVTLDAITPEAIGAILDTVSMTPNGNRRVVPRLLMAVNPADYYTKVFPATTVRATDGSYNNDVFPYPTDVVVSAAVPANRAVLGLASKYFMALGTSQGGKLEYSDEYKFLEDIRIYLVKLYGNGRPLDENAFVLADITNLKPTTLQVEVTNADDFPTA